MSVARQSRRSFIGSAAALAAVGDLCAEEVTAGSAPLPLDRSVFEALRRQLRAFHPDECHQTPKSPECVASFKAIENDVEAYAAGHPGFDALDLRIACYRAMRRHFKPIIFSESPFYFVAGVNGGWTVGCAPARVVNRIARRFYADRGLIPEDSLRMNDRRSAMRFSLCCGPLVDDQHHLTPYHEILGKGFGGLKAETEAALASCPAGDALGRRELEAALEGFETIHAIQLSFAAEAEKAAAAAVPGSREAKWAARIAESAKRCPWEPPRTFYEGLNALWFIREILAYVDGLCQFTIGRPDAWLIGLYEADIAAGRLTREEARDLMARWLVHADCHLDSYREINSWSDQEAEIPVTLGGCDAQGRPVWNDITRTLMDAHLELDLVFPKLHLRFDRESPGEYLRKIGAMLLRDHAVFALFNDTRHIGNFVRLGIPLERARDYVGSGCWDGQVDSETDADTANYMSVIRFVELAFHPEPDVVREFGLVLDPIDGARSFEEVRDTIYRNFMRFFKGVISEYTRYGRANAQVFPHPVYTMCLTGGAGRRRDVMDAGANFTPRIVTLAFLANTVDSLCAIRKLCFEDRVCTLPELIDAVQSNWRGEKGERLRMLALDAPYWGDNTPASNDLMKWWITRVTDEVDGLRNDRGGPYVVACWIYREFVLWGEQTRATPDGRRDGDRLAQGFAPSEYRCKSAATTVFNAIGTLPHDRLYASNANLAFDKSGMTPELFEAVFRVASAKGMHLLQPNCLSVEELRDAQLHPERHHNIIVKVCGYSARFVSLSRKYQDEVINRHRLK